MTLECINEQDRPLMHGAHALHSILVDGAPLGCLAALYIRAKIGTELT